LGEELRYFKCAKSCGLLYGLALCVAFAASGCDLPLPVTVQKIAYGQQEFDGLDYFLTKGIVSLTIKSNAPSTGQPNVSLTINTVAYIADPDFHYSVSINHDVLFDDDITVTTDGTTGLLKSINTTTTDQTPAILETLAQAPVSILKLTSEKISSTASSFNITFNLDPTSVEDRTRLNQILKALTPAIQFNAKPVVPLPYGPNMLPDCGFNICFRTAMAYALELSTTDDAVVARQIVVLPNKYVLGQVPITRAPFVTKKFVMAFTNGMLTSLQITNPSEALAFVQIPIAIAKSIASIPSAVLQFKTTQITADNNLLTAQQNNLSLQRQIIQAQQQLLAAQVAKP
jgi:hypothetical protein